MSRVEVIGWRTYVIAGGDRNALDGLPPSPLLVRALSLQTQCSRRPKRPLRVAFRVGGLLVCDFIRLFTDREHNVMVDTNV